MGIVQRRGGRVLAGGVLVLLVASALTYLLWAAYLALLGDEGSLPPAWRDPDLPPGAQVVSRTERCASGGCWRELVVRPADGQTPEELAEAIGLGDGERHGWRWYDPHSVEYVVTPVDGDLRVDVGY